MERLTKTYSDGTHGASDSLPCGENSYDYKNLLIEKLGKYEDLEEQGRLIKLPCKEAYTKSGEIVYLIYDDEVVECTHCGLSINPVDGKAYITIATDEDVFPYRRPIPEYDLDPTDWCTNTISAEVGEIGKIVFLTKSEAEAKLKELIENNGKSEK